MAEGESALQRMRRRRMSVGPEDKAFDMQPQEVLDLGLGGGIGAQAAVNERMMSESAELDKLETSDPLSQIVGGTSIETPLAHFRARQRGEPDRSDLATEEEKKMLWNIGTSAAVGLITQGQSVPFQMVAQGLATGGVETALNLKEGKSLKDSAVAGAEVGGVDAALEGAIPVVGKVAGKVVRGIKGAAPDFRAALRSFRGIDPPAARAKIGPLNEPFRQFLEGNIDETFWTVRSWEGNPSLTQGQAVDHPIVDRIEGILESAIISPFKLFGQRKAAANAGRAELKKIADAMEPFTREEMSEFIQIAHKRDTFRVKGAAQAIYKEVDEKMAGAANVDISGIKKMIQESLDDADEGFLKNQFSTLKDILDKGDFVTYKSASRIRTELFDISKQFGLGPADVVKGERLLARRLAGNLTQSISRAAKNEGPEVAAMLADANRIWGKELKGELTNEVFSALLKKQPEELADSLLNYGSPGTIGMVMRMAERQNPMAARRIRGTLFQRILESSTDASTGVINSTEVSKNIHKWAEADGARVKAFFGGKGGAAKFAHIKKTAQAAATAERKTGGDSSGTMFFQLLQAGAVAGTAGATIGFLLGGDSESAAKGGTLGAGAVVVGPALLEGLWTTPAVTKWLTVGAEHIPGSQKSLRAILGVGAYMLREKLLEPEEGEKMVNIMQAAQTKLRNMAGSMSFEKRLNQREDARAYRTALP